MQITSPEQKLRVLKALTETCQLIEKEMRYSPDLRKPDYLASLERHSDKLNKMLDEYRQS